MALFESIYRFFGWWVINVDLFLLLLLIMGSGLMLFRRKVWGKRFLFTACIGFVFFGIVPIGLWTIEHLENRFPKIQSIPPDTKGMILLGGSFDKVTTLARGETAYNLTGGRFFQFIELAKEYPQLQLVFTGTPFEVETAKRGFKALGLDPNSVIFEGSSKDTRENAAKTASLLKPMPQEKWILITSAYHMPRSVGLFRKAGFNVIPFPLDYHSPGNYEPWLFIGLTLNFNAWQASSREWLGMIANYLMGRSDEVFPSVD
ncbi:MAG TPA: YdcF family protein [Alphaproteobacteria bacterium]|nr:YdcF family protein [Alphaproteobacteria bacterium]